MSAESPSKLNNLLRAQPAGVVLCSAWLVDNGYSNHLQKRYKKSQWFESVGTGALIRFGDQVDYLGAVYALLTRACNQNGTVFICARAIRRILYPEKASFCSGQVKLATGL